MKSYRVIISTLILSLAFLVAACGSQIAGGDDKVSEPDLVIENTQPPAEPTETVPAPTPESTLYTFEELGFSLEVPTDLTVIQDPIVDSNDSSKLEMYLFYIQNYGSPDGPSSGNFQIYGLLQFSIPTVTWEELAIIQDDTTNYQYVKPIEINGLKGFDTQLAGERNNYVYLFHLKDHVLRIAVSDPTPENKARAEEILNTLALIP
ncbi:MAG: hypothetical protein MUO54_16695 [Anaerolineales bacterium]|nr:hypothetical protein [Anaerolineales bacterium]